MRYMLDTNICIYIIKRKPVHVIEKFRTYMSGDIVISSITLSELEYGVQKSAFPEKNGNALTLFIASLDVISYDDDAAIEYGHIRASLEKMGMVIGSLDMLIAAHAKSLNIPIITNNSAEFERIDNLKVENWI